MALSSQWSQSVVVRADRQGEVIVPPTPNNRLARSYAEIGNPLVVRPRDPTMFSAKDGRSDSAAGEHHHGTLVTALLGRDISETFWVPDPSKNEMGLLEMLHRRGSANVTHILLQNRPLPELHYNFSTCTGYNIDLSHDAFRLSKPALAMQQMTNTLSGMTDYVPYEDAQGGGRSRGGGASRHASPPPSHISVSPAGLQQAVCASLQSMREENYYLVKYRDYSAWANSEYRTIAKSDSMFGKKYVEQCFAVHVGMEPGELILITESQFLFGVDILQRQLLNQLSNVPTSRSNNARDANHASYQQYQLEVNFCTLNTDQFRSLGVMLGDGLRPVGVEGEERKRAEAAKHSQAAAASGSYVAPAWYDWSPGAIRTRVQHKLATYYLSVGRLTVQMLVLGACSYVVYSYVKVYIPGSGGADDFDRSRGDRRRGQRDRGGRGGSGRRGGRDSYDDYGDDYYRPGLLRSILGGPKDVFDYILAPSSDVRGRDY